VTCTEFIAQLDDLLENRVSAKLKAKLDEHLRTCEHCVITMNTTRKTIEIYRSHELYELPNDLRVRLQKAILAKCKKC
jgi:Putative zinc-finger